MRSSRRSRTIVETAVFAAAILLAGFLARELWLRRRPAPAPEAPAAPAVAAPVRPAWPKPAPQAEVGTAGSPPVRMTRIEKRRPKTSVPSPR